MTAKYSIDQNDATTWDSDTRHILYKWETKPFMGHRHETVHQRLVVEYHHGVGLDVLWQCRSEDSGKFSDDWETIERIEAREYGCRHERTPKARYVR